MSVFALIAAVLFALSWLLSDIGETYFIVDCWGWLQFSIPSQSPLQSVRLNRNGSHPEHRITRE